MLSGLIITFLPRSKHLLISWLQSPSAVILEPPQKKPAAASTVSPTIYHEVMGPDVMILVFWMLSFQPAFPLSSFTSSRGFWSPPGCLSSVPSLKNPFQFLLPDHHENLYSWPHAYRKTHLFYHFHTKDPQTLTDTLIFHTHSHLFHALEINDLFLLNMLTWSFELLIFMKCSN